MPVRNAAAGRSSHMGGPAGAPPGLVEVADLPRSVPRKGNGQHVQGPKSARNAILSRPFSPRTNVM